MKTDNLEEVKRALFRLKRNKPAIIGFFIIGMIIIAAIFAYQIIPYPKHIGAYIDFGNMNKPPSAAYWLGTDNIGRDVLSRLIVSLRSALLMGVIVLAISVPVGFTLGVIAGYMKGTLVEVLIMRITDIFLSIPALVLALAIASVFKPNLTNAMIAITVMWWPWYARLAYGISSSLRNENFIIYAQLTGASLYHILAKEMLPNCISPVLTKMTLDMGLVIMMGATLGFVGLGEQPPAPSLGNMISDGIKYIPDQWWVMVFPAIFIIIIVLGFNLVGDGVSSIFSVEEE
jgi:peptide/nickel transport system permease protein